MPHAHAVKSSCNFSNNTSDTLIQKTQAKHGIDQTTLNDFLTRVVTCPAGPRIAMISWQREMAVHAAQPLALATAVATNMIWQWPWAHGHAVAMAMALNMGYWALVFYDGGKCHGPGHGPWPFG